MPLGSVDMIQPFVQSEARAHDDHWTNHLSQAKWLIKTGQSEGVWNPLLTMEKYGE